MCKCAQISAQTYHIRKQRRFILKVSSVITEYNPFHNGHKYQLNKVSEETGCDYKVIIMSGNFVQRGQPAIMDKYTRTNMALSCGADLVLELPVSFASSSAEFFAKGAISILDSCSVIDTLCYGVENNEHGLIREIASVLHDEPQLFSDILKKYMKSGMSYPAARTKSLLHVLRGYDTVCESAVSEIISSPNNILAVEYEKALLDTKITGFPIKRIGSGYHDTDHMKSFPSATAIRNLLSSSGARLTENMIPEECSAIIDEYTKDHSFVFENDISELLYYKLLSLKNEGYRNFSDCNEELSRKISKNLYKYKNFTQFCELIKSKNYTYSRISRVLIHIMLDIKDDDLLQNPYIRILGFKKSAAPLLHAIKKEASAPIITKVADAPYELISNDIFAADIYNRLCKNDATNEFTHGPVIM